MDGILAQAKSRAQRDGAACGVRAMNIGDRVRKKSGSEWQGRIVGTYRTALTPEGYAVESEAHPGSAQIYPATALEPVEDTDTANLIASLRRYADEAAKIKPRWAEIMRDAALLLHADEKPEPGVERLAADHWLYVRNTLIAHGETAEILDKCGYHYRTAFAHGYKHGVEAEREKDR